MSEELSAFRIKQGRRVYDIYNIINSLSFALVTGNTITLYALSLGANSTIVGLLNAFMYFCYFAIPLGKLMVRKYTLIRTFAYAWFMRNLSLLPMLVIPLFFFAGNNFVALNLLVLSVACFNIFRGAGMIANNPVIKILAPGKDRSSYIVRISLTNNAATLIATLLLAGMLWINISVTTYNIATIIGMISGFIASALLLKLPDPEKEAEKGGEAQTPLQEPAEQHSFFTHARDAFKDANFRLFITAFFIVGFGIGMARPFIIVFAKEVYGTSDSLATIFTVCSSFGALIVGLIMRLVIDRIGAKPMYIIFSSLALVTLIPAIIAPGLGTVSLAIVVLCLISMITNMGFVGQDNAAQAYFFAMVPEEAIMDLSMLYYFVLGITGGGGAILGGTILDFFKSLGFSNLESYRIFFIGIIVIIAIGLLFQAKLLNLGSYRVFETLAVLFSPRDMKALNLLHKLDSNQNLEAEQNILKELGEIASSVSADQLGSYLESPRFSIRYGALQALYSIEALSSKNREDLLLELKSGAFTTASSAARILGKFKVQQAIPALRTALDSEDYALAGEAMLALANLNDTYSQIKIGNMIANTDNPFLLLRGIQALETFGSISSLPLILDLLRQENLPLHVEDEALLALSSLMGIQNAFYYAFERYKNKQKAPNILLIDALDESFSLRKKHDEKLKNIVLQFIQDYQYDTEFVNWLIEYGDKRLGVRAALLIGVAVDLDLINQEPFRFFICFWAACIFRNPKLIES
ncbi:MFS transporter [Treponema phagedenis]|uniref:MFS transporter n=1 Tax=Treponema phagedenis TaxID=162 RepID=UPI0011E7398F|nr:MFS transporter [Treponema phagedenis]QEK01644.1 MFS transporter [Treponema phagedenis]QEK03109.1 MFS transporter [Treponema phagedenis]QEK06763.1 MFS transporter [Treponema phagedenis]QEK08735.1 MFS transporter [Treponema phagedenis]